MRDFIKLTIGVIIILFLFSIVAGPQQVRDLFESPNYSHIN